MLQVVVNFVLFQLCWFTSILGAANGLPWLGPAAVAGSVFGQMFWRKSVARELPLLMVAALLGLGLDGFLAHVDAIRFVGFESEYSFAVPLWMALLWVNFAGTLPSSLAWLRTKLVAAGILGAIGGPLAYYGGESFGAIEFGELGRPAGLVAVGVEYLIATPLLVVVSNRLLPPRTKQGQESSTDDERD